MPRFEVGETVLWTNASDPEEQEVVTITHFEEYGGVIYAYFTDNSHDDIQYLSKLPKNKPQKGFAKWASKNIST